MIELNTTLSLGKGKREGMKKRTENSSKNYGKDDKEAVVRSRCHKEVRNRNPRDLKKVHKGLGWGGGGGWS